jgi:hypothetical protein
MRWRFLQQEEAVDLEQGEEQRRVGESGTEPQGGDDFLADGRPSDDKPGPALPDSPDVGYRERAELADALVATRKLRHSKLLPAHAMDAVDAFADLLAHYAPERSLKSIPTVGPSAHRADRPVIRSQVRLP